MNVSALRQVLLSKPDASMRFTLPDGGSVPAHFHITEVGHVRKDFVDCGGTRRTTAACVLQLWVANDLGHRLKAGKLASIIDIASPLLGGQDLPVEVEYEGETMCLYLLEAATADERGLQLRLGGKHTACLAPDQCGVDANACCPPGCC